MNFIGHLDAVFGLGTSARGFADALVQADIPLNVLDMDDGVPGRHRVAIDYPADTLQPVNIVHMTLAHLQGQRLLEAGPLAELVTPARYNIGIVYWELDRLQPEWQGTIDRFDEFWCASTFLARAMSASFKGPVRVVRPALARKRRQPATTRADFGLPDGKFVFFYSADAGSVLGRKNPRAFIDAYVNEFAEHEGAACFVKILYGKPDDPEVAYIRQVAQGRRDIVFSDRTLSTSEMDDLFTHIDCYVSPHRSEGLGLTVLEAMLARKPVIATPYGGVEDFVSSRTALPLDFRMVEIGPGNEPYPADGTWADPLPESIRAHMRTLFADRVMAQSIGEAGYRQASAMFSGERSALQIRQELTRIGRIVERRAESFAG